MKIKNVKMIELQDWDKLVEKTYGKIYCFQQQDGCKPRGIFELTIPDESNDYPNDSIPYIINGNEMGVSFKAWLDSDPNNFPVESKLFWKRNWYPDIQMIANDLHSKGLIEAGEYIINIDW